MFAANGVPKGSGEPGGCTRDIVHRFYQEQYQLNGGRQNRYTTGSDAVGLTQGFYRTRDLPIYKYLHRTGAPKYVLADRFFQAAFGGSFLNHQWLIAARTPLDTSHGADGAAGANSVLDSNGMVNDLPALHADRRRQRRPADPQVQRPAADEVHAAPAATSRSTPSSRPARPRGDRREDPADRRREVPQHR